MKEEETMAEEPKHKPCPACNTVYGEVRTSPELNDKAMILDPQQAHWWGEVMGNWIWYKNTHNIEDFDGCCQKTKDLFNSLNQSTLAMGLERAEAMVKMVVEAAEHELMKGREGNC